MVFFWTRMRIVVAVVVGKKVDSLYKILVFVGETSQSKGR